MSRRNDALRADDEYYSHNHDRVIDLIGPVAGKRVLEVGCGTGELLSTLKTLGAAYVEGIELRDDVACAAAGRAGVDKVYSMDLMSDDFFAKTGHPNSAKFDLIVINFVLEHVVDPWEMLRRLASVANRGARVVGCVPNVKHVSVTLPLIFRGRWEYTDEGIMDWTHAKWFTKSTVRDLFDDTSWTLARVDYWVQGRRYEGPDRMTLGALRSWLAFAILFDAELPC